MSSHPVPYERLIDYAADDLNDLEAAAVAGHVATCRECAATVSRYRAVRRVLSSAETLAPSLAALARARALFRHTQPSVQAGRLQGLLPVVARLAFDSLKGPVLIGVRGTGNPRHILFESEVADVDLQMERVTEHGETVWHIIGQVGLDEPPPVIPVALVRTGSALPSVELDADEHGIFSIQAVEGHYALHVRLPSTLLILPDLEIG